MKTNIEFPVIRGALVIFLVTLVIVALMLASTYYFRSQMSAEYNRNKAAFQGISQRYLAVDQEEKYIREFYPEYSGLHNDGIIGREHRLNWIEVLRNSGKENKLPSVDYQISSQKEYDNLFPLAKGNYKIYISSMDLSLKLLHEGDLLNLMGDLSQKANGLFSIRKCELNRKSKVIERSSGKVNIEANCTLDWFNIKKADGTELSI